MRTRMCTAECVAKCGEARELWCGRCGMVWHRTRRKPGLTGAAVVGADVGAEVQLGSASMDLGCKAWLLVLLMEFIEWLWPLICLGMKFSSAPGRSLNISIGNFSPMNYL